MNAPHMLRHIALGMALIVLARLGEAGAQTSPTVTGPLPVSATSFPFLAAERNLQPEDLKAYGYVEEEFMISGSANIYDWAADGAIAVRTPNATYTTRILVRHPADPARFSGNVVVELLNAVRRYDWAWMWGYSKQSFMEHGDAWVGITMPGGVQSLKQFNATRYAALGFPNPSQAPCGPGGAAAISNSEEGSKWDAITQIGTLLQSTAENRPLAGLRVQAIFLTTGQSPDLMTYINAIHSQAKLPNGKPVYSGYLIKQPGNPSRINQCATAPAKGDVRQAIRPLNVPVVAVYAQGEVLDGLTWRREDSDLPNDRFRLYEVAGASHIEWAPYTGLPAMQDQAATGIMPAGTADWPIAARCEPDIPLQENRLMTYVFDSAFVNLQLWARNGPPAPKAARLELNDAGSPMPSLRTDSAGNALGGVRNPYVDVPNGTYWTTSPGPGTCRELGHKVSFDPKTLDTRYGSAQGYGDAVAKAVDAQVRERWLTEADGRRLKSEAAKPRP